MSASVDLVSYTIILKMRLELLIKAPSSNILVFLISSALLGTYNVPIAASLTVLL
jgi:Ca2+/Na+ antiporter